MSEKEIMAEMNARIKKINLTLENFLKKNKDKYKLALEDTIKIAEDLNAGFRRTDKTAD